jgi:hypothetical protein
MAVIITPIAMLFASLVERQQDPLGEMKLLLHAHNAVKK